MNWQLPGGGEFEPERDAVDAAHDAGDRIEVRALEDGPAVVIEVADTGPGIDPGKAESIFQPFFSEKKGGTGLGLAIVRRLVESWGGSVSAESTPGEGTVIRIVISVWSGEETASVSPREEGEA